MHLCSGLKSLTPVRIEIHNVDVKVNEREYAQPS